MNHLENDLIKGEEIVKKAQFHRIRFTLPVIVGVFLFPIGPIVCGIWIYIMCQTELAITNKRVFGYIQGLLSKSTVEQSLKKTEGIAIYQSLMGRICGYGRIVITTGGVTHDFHYVLLPYEFRKILNEQMDVAQA